MDDNNNPQSQPPSQTPYQAPVPPPSNNSPEPNDITGVDSNKLMAAVSYLGILVIIPLLISRKDKFVLFHAKQGLVLLLVYVVAGIAMSWIPIIGNLVGLLGFVASIAGLIQALQGKWWKMPLIGDLAAKFRI